MDYKKIPTGTQKVILGNGAQEEVVGIGTYQLKLHLGRTLLLHDVLHAPGVQCNLFSVLTMLRLGFSFYFNGPQLDFYLNKTLYGHGYLFNNFFMLDLDHSSFSFIAHTDDISDSVMWYARLGHIGKDRLARLAREGLLGSITNVSLPMCEPCLAGKACRKPFDKAPRATHPLELVHSEICGPMNVKACHGTSYFLTFIDDYSRFSYFYLISHRFVALDCFKRFVAEVENQKERNVKVFQTNRGREYLAKQFQELCEEKGIRRQLTIPSTPQQNGVAERRNRTLLEMVRPMMAQANLPISFWGDALLIAAYILNHVPSKLVPTTPYELWTGTKPNLENLQPWGCAGFVHSTSHKYGKLGPRASKKIFIRYSESSKGNVMYGEHFDGGMTKIESRDVNFIEDDFPSISEAKQDLQLYELQELEGVIPFLGEGGESQLHLEIAKDSGSDLAPSGSKLLDSDTQGSKVRRSERGTIPRHHF